LVEYLHKDIAHLGGEEGEEAIESPLVSDAIIYDSGESLVDLVLEKLHILLLDAPDE
jgi:hypothetical protein